jgi:membrane protein DedA with SNARE-associated domain
MTLDQYLLLGLVQYGLPVLFAAILLAAIGTPLPATLLLLTAGAFVAHGELNLWWVVGLATCAAVLGDQLGYGIGRWGSQRLITRLSRWGGGASRMAQAQQVAARWGGAGVFFSRWLLTPIGPVVNLTSGIARYPWPTFFCVDVAGEVLWVCMYVMLGRIFSDQVQTLSSALGNVTWVVVGLLAMIVLVRFLRQQRTMVSSS